MARDGSAWDCPQGALREIPAHYEGSPADSNGCVVLVSPKDLLHNEELIKPRRDAPDHSWGQNVWGLGFESIHDAQFRAVEYMNIE